MQALYYSVLLQVLVLVLLSAAWHPSLHPAAVTNVKDCVLTPLSELHLGKAMCPRFCVQVIQVLSSSPIYLKQESPPSF